MSTGNLGTLVVRMALEIKRYKAELSEAVRDTRTAMDQAGRATDGLTQKSKGLEQQAANTARQVRQVGEAIHRGDYARAGQQAAGLATNVGRAGTAMGVLSAGVGIAASALVAYTAISFKASQEHERQANLLALTGNAAAILTRDINAMASSVAESANTTVGKAREITEALVSTGKIGRTATESLAGAAELFAQASDQTREKVAGDFAKMADGVAKWAAKHNEQYNFLTADQWNYIRGLEEQGRKQEAMIVVGDAFQKHLSGIQDNVGTLQRAWRSLGNVASQAWDAVLNIGRAQTSQDQLDAATARVNQLRDQIERRRASGQLESTMGRDTANLQHALQAQALLQESIRLERRSAEAKAESAARQREQIELSQKWGDISKKSLSDEAKLQERIKEIRAAGAAAGASQTEIEAAVAKAREDSARSIGRQSAATRRLTDEERELAEERRRGMAVVALRNKLAEDSFRLREREAASIAANSAAYAAALDKQVLAAYADAAAAEQQVAQYGMSKVQIAELTLAKLEDARAQAMLSALTLADVRALDAQVAAQKRVVDASRNMEVRESATKAAKEAETAWQKTADSIESTLTEALMRGFESGEGFGENLADSIVNTFKTYVAREIATTISRAIMSAIASTQWGQALGSIIGGATGSGGGINWGSVVSMGYKYATGGTTAGASTSGISAAGVGGTSWMAIAGWAAAAVALIYAGDKLYDQGYRRESVVDSTAYQTSMARWHYQANKMLGMNEKWAQILSGTTFYAHQFGEYQKMSGVRGNFDGAGGIQTDQFRYYKRGQLVSALGSKDRVESEALDAQRAQSLTNSLRDVQDSTAVLVQAMGGNAEAVRSFAGGVTIDLQGLSQSDAMKRMAEEFQDLQYRMAEAAGISREAFQGIIDSVNASMERAGISGETIADIITAGATGRLSEVEVGAQMADVIIGGIYNSIAQGPADMVAQAFTSQIIQPLLTAALMGAPLAGVVSQAAIQSVVATAQKAVEIINAVYNDPAFRQAISDIQSTISQVSRISVQPARNVRSFGTAALNAANDSKRAAEEIRRAWQGIADSITAEMRRLKGEILGDRPESEAAAQASFAIATAQARSGNREAAAMLPELSRAVIDIANQTANSLGDLRAVQGATLESLAETRRIVSRRFGLKIPAFADGGEHAGGWAMVGERGPEMAYLPPARIYNAGDTKSLLGGSDEVVTELKALRQDFRAMQDTMALIKKVSDKTADNTGAMASDLNDTIKGRTTLKTRVAA